MSPTARSRKKESKSRGRLVKVARICDETYQEALREEAMGYMPSAVDKLAELADNGPDVVARQAAMDLIRLGGEKPKTRLEEQLHQIGDLVVNVTVNQFEEIEKPEPVVIAAKKAIEASTIEDAQIIETGEGGSAPADMFQVAEKF